MAYLRAIRPRAARTFALQNDAETGTIDKPGKILVRNAGHSLENGM